MTNSRILVIGKTGQLGRSILNLSNNFISSEIKFVDKSELNLLSIESIKSFFKTNIFDIIINCAAYTAVDRAEEESEKADFVNNVSIQYLCELTKLYKTTVVHISTDYVFDGKKLSPYSENDVTNPQSVYGMTKLNGEKKLQEFCNSFIIFRTSWVYSVYKNNFVKSIIRLGKNNRSIEVVNDEIGSPTSATDLAGAIINIINSKDFQTIAKNKTIINYCNEGAVSRYEFAKEILNQCDITCEIKKIKSSDYKTLARRPLYSVLDTSLFKKLTGQKTIHWISSLREVLNEINI